MKVSGGWFSTQTLSLVTLKSITAANGLVTQQDFQSCHIAVRSTLRNFVPWSLETYGHCGLQATWLISDGGSELFVHWFAAKRCGRKRNKCRLEYGLGCTGNKGKHTYNCSFSKDDTVTGVEMHVCPFSDRAFRLLLFLPHIHKCLIKLGSESYGGITAGGRRRAESSVDPHRPRLIPGSPKKQL